MVIITNYVLTNKAVFFFVESREPSYCPVCGEPLLMRSTRQRTLYNSIGTKGKLVIRRLYVSIQSLLTDSQKKVYPAKH